MVRRLVTSHASPQPWVMAATVLFEVKKKRRGTSTKKSPFPLVFHLGCEDKSSIVAWQFYRGSLRPDGVEVSDAEDMKNLYYMVSLNADSALPVDRLLQLVLLRQTGVVRRN